MKEFLFECGWILISIIGFVGYFIWYYKKYGKEKGMDRLRKVVYTAMQEAEKKWPSGSGRIKVDQVCSTVYDAMPRSLRLIISYQQVMTWCQSLYDLTEDYLEDGKLNWIEKK